MDNPYIVSSSYSVEDPFPLTTPNNKAEFSFEYPEPPVIVSVEDLEIEYNSGNFLTWQVNSTAPDSYRIFRNGSEIEIAAWDGNPITTNLDQLNLGLYNFTIWVGDSYGQIVIDSVMVHVIDTTLPQINGSGNLQLTKGSTGNEAVWSVYDSHGDEFMIFHNGSLMENGIWGWEVPIRYSLDDLELGIHNLTLVVSDTSGNIASDVVIVTVISPPVTTIPPTSSTPGTTSTISSSLPSTASSTMTTGLIDTNPVSENTTDENSASVSIIFVYIAIFGMIAHWQRRPKGD